MSCETDLESKVDIWSQKNRHVKDQEITLTYEHGRDQDMLQPMNMWICMWAYKHVMHTKGHEEHV